MLAPLYFFNELRLRLGTSDALNVFYRLRVAKTDKLSVSYLKYPFKIRTGNGSDLATFKEVIVRKEYTLELPFTPERIIDGGANIGLTSLFFANKYPDADIVSVEPDGDNFKLMKDNTSFYKRIQPINSALWSKKTNLKVVDSGRGTDGYTVEETTETGNNTFMATSISEIMKDRNWDVIDVLKIDVEGSEKELFSNGYEAWLPKTRVLIVETHDRFAIGSSKAVFSAMCKYNFSCTIQGFNLVFVNQDIA